MTTIMLMASSVSFLLSSALTSAEVKALSEPYEHYQLARVIAIFIVVLANVSFAGMRAQGSNSKGWKWLSFLVGLPLTIVSFVFVRPGSGMMYGIRLPLR